MSPRNAPARPKPAIETQRGTQVPLEPTGRRSPTLEVGDALPPALARSFLSSLPRSRRPLLRSRSRLSVESTPRSLSRETRWLFSSRLHAHSDDQDLSPAPVVRRRHKPGLSGPFPREVRTGPAASRP